MQTLEQIPRINYPPWEAPNNRYECRVLLCPEPDGGFSAHALRLPGVVSQGENEAEALKNISEAFHGAVSVYLKGSRDIPWEDVEINRQGDCRERWIGVDVF